MKKTMIMVLLFAGLSACGAKQTPAETETVATTEETADTTESEVSDVPEENSDAADDAAAADGEKLPPPPDVAAPPANAESSDSGLHWLVLEEGDGEGSPTIDSTITVHYSGWKTDGEMFDSSVVRGEPIEFPLNKLIGGWQEGIPMMSKGAKYRFWIPGELAYANSPRPDAPKGMLVFDIELIDFAN